MSTAELGAAARLATWLNGRCCIFEPTDEAGGLDVMCWCSSASSRSCDRARLCFLLLQNRSKSTMTTRRITAEHVSECVCECGYVAYGLQSRYLRLHLCSGRDVAESIPSVDLKSNSESASKSNLNWDGGCDYYYYHRRNRCSRQSQSQSHLLDCNRGQS